MRKATIILVTGLMRANQEAYQLLIDHPAIKKNRYGFDQPTFVQDRVVQRSRKSQS